MKVIKEKWFEDISSQANWRGSAGLLLCGLHDQGSGTLDTLPNILFFKPYYSKGQSVHIQRKISRLFLRTFIILEQCFWEFDAKLKVFAYGEIVMFIGKSAEVSVLVASKGVWRILGQTTKGSLGMWNKRQRLPWTTRRERYCSIEKQHIWQHNESLTITTMENDNVPSHQ